MDIASNDNCSENHSDDRCENHSDSCGEKHSDSCSENYSDNLGRAMVMTVVKTIGIIEQRKDNHRKDCKGKINIPSCKVAWGEYQQESDIVGKTASCSIGK